jgi:hypothetical protein
VRLKGKRKKEKRNNWCHRLCHLLLLPGGIKCNEKDDDDALLAYAAAKWLLNW